MVFEELSALHVPDWFLFTEFVLANAFFTATTFLWTIGKRQKTPSKLMSLALALMGISFWAFMGVTPEELFLVFLPLCISFGIICSCFIDRAQIRQKVVLVAEKSFQ
jgi:hypothetical protein